MKLEALRLENFRQFFDKQVLRFSQGSEKNVTIVFGANGSGKTALLNAFTWLLYGEHTPGFEIPERLVNERALDEATVGEEVSARVTLEFEHEGRFYKATRVTTDRKLETGIERMKDGELTLEIIGEDGRAVRPDNPSMTVNQVLPKRLHSFFFFDGERIEELAKDSAYEEIGDAIKSVLGLEVIERSIRHLDRQVRNRLQGELREVGSTEIQHAVDREVKLREKLEEKEEERTQVQKNRRAWETELGKVNTRLRGLEEAKHLQEKRDLFEARREETQEAIRTVRRALSTRCSKEGFLAFAPSLIDEAEAVLDEKREKGEIPVGIKRQFVDDLLERAECICGTPLSEGSSEYEQVAMWKMKAGLDEIEEVRIRMSGELAEFRRVRKELYESASEKLEQLSKLKATKRKLDEQIAEISIELGEKDSEEVQTLESKREELKTKIADDIHRLGVLSNEIDDLRDSVEEQRAEIDRLKQENETAELARRRLRASEEAGKFFQEMYDELAELVRRKLDDRIRQLYQDISFKPYTPKLTEDYRLLLTKAVGASDDELVAKSTGENQLLSLSFIGSVVDFARQRYEEHKDDTVTRGLGFKGGIYPIVMDSPFGSLDENYRAQLAAAVPKLAPQAILFVSKSQGMGTVLEELEPSIGQISILEYLTPKETVAGETIDIRGERRSYIKRSDDNYEIAFIREL